MKLNEKKKGMTLVEIIISMSIFGILVVVFLNLFLTSFIMIKRSGDRTITSVAASTEMDKVINNPLNYSSSNVVKQAITSTNPITITYQDNSIKKIIGCQVMVTTADTKGHTIVIKGFLP
ncbi:type II secretion system GspH family protein [Clostridium estertheticum]|uniref:type IV pilus modification PilV family protein n=1 Tax=Clostridium estertheticum TaxID=238834 RepID=UPI001C0C6744|nr:type II secretion system protein [Clostridium estertheticum]MBU3216750.1 type II secretion system GspH family protein [Clostridium estertheticum]WAG54284.1 type II secretion system GspH family protein [Clostridium estertheticum]